MATTLMTPRLRLVPMTLACCASPDAREVIESVTAARLPDGWPVEHYDQEALDYTRGVLEKEPETEYLMRYLVTRDGEPTVIGIVGGSAPDEGNAVIGYSVHPDWQRRGFAGEALAALVEWMRGDPRVQTVVGETYPHLIPSIRTMEHCGFTFAGAGSGEGIIKYELPLRG
jgi:ribosomal-protein-alanine N-acetyltransferase